MGWFWFLLTILGTFVVFKTGEVLFDREIGVMSALLFSTRGKQVK